jgi:iron complex outermembrane receptor protein
MRPGWSGTAAGHRGRTLHELGNAVPTTATYPRVNLTYKIDKDKMVYATWSEGFRPGGVNRTAAAGVPPYQADFLTNYEIGWKTQWFNHHLRWNGAIFQEDWKNFQFSFLGVNSVTIIQNAGNARIRGIENEIEFAATSNLTLSTGFTFLDPKLTSNYCNEPDPTATGEQAHSNPCPAGWEVRISKPATVHAAGA